MRIEPGMQLEKDGIRIHVHEIWRGQVLFQKFPISIDWQNTFVNLWRIPADVFEEKIREEKPEIIYEEN